jgi:hypothetical protein
MALPAILTEAIAPPQAAEKNEPRCGGARKFCDFSQVAAECGRSSCSCDTQGGWRGAIAAFFKKSQPMRAMIAVGGGLLAAVCFSGCSSFMNVMAPPVAATAVAEDQSAAQTVLVTLKPKNGRIKQKTIPYTEGMSVQTALEQSGAIRKFTDMDIKVYRVTPLSKGQAVPLQSDYDPSKNRVPVLNDLALHPGDKVLLEENNNSQLDIMIANITGNAAKRREVK